MNNHKYACGNYRSCDISRRSMLRIGGLGMFGMTIPGLLKAAGQPRSWPIRGSIGDISVSVGRSKPPGYF